MSKLHSAAIMFADISGSSRLFKQAGDIEARRIIAQVVQMMMEKTRDNSGIVIKTIGDECMSEFPSACTALNACIDIQNNIDNTNYGAPLSIRIGFHYGVIIKEDGDIYGEAVNDAADLVKVAKGGQTITSHHTRNQLSPEQQKNFNYFDEIRIKGGNTLEKIYIYKQSTLLPDNNSTMFMSAIDFDALEPDTEEDKITLSYEGQELALNVNDMPFSIGRDPSADLVVKFHMSSREHCKLDYRRGKFVLIDNSTNGTHVVPEGRKNIYLRREEIPLLHNGVISFSKDFHTPGPHLIRYHCE